MQWWIAFSTFAVTFTLAAILVPISRRAAWKWGYLDKPLAESHKKHQKSTPVLGGVAMLVAWVTTVGGGYLLLRLAPHVLPESLSMHHGGAMDSGRRVLIVLAGAVAIAALGFRDDRKPLSARAKFTVQALICGLVALEPKLQVSLFSDLFLVRWGLTLGWYLFIINAFNFFDNMDGLAAGMAVIAASMFTIVAVIQGQAFVPPLGAATAGAALGFYLYNKAPATTFMGDCGSHLLGYLLATMGAVTQYWTVGSESIAPVFIPLFILALPIFDTFAVVIIRLRLGQPIYHGDHNHISHRFRRLGFGAGTAVLLVHLLSLSLGLTAILLLWLPHIMGVGIVFAQAAAILTLVSIVHTIKPEPR